MEGNWLLQIRRPQCQRIWLRSCFKWLLFLSVVILVYLLPSGFLQTHIWTNRTQEEMQLISPQTTSQSQGVHTNVAYARNYRFIIDEPDSCHGNVPFLVLMVPVAPSNLAARVAIRMTWGNQTMVQDKLVQTFFMLGLPGGPNTLQQQEEVQQESQMHHDLIQSNFMDTYINLTIKTMVIMDWLATRCPETTYAMKIDSDMFLNVQNLVTMLLTPDLPKVNYLTGLLQWNAKVRRDPSTKWYVPEEIFPNDTYPTYALGMGYVFSNDLPGKLVEVSKGIKPFSIEDVYVGVCMLKLGLSPMEPPSRPQWKEFVQTYNRCEFSSVITYILSTSAQLVEYWTDLYKPGPPCRTRARWWLGLEP